MNPLIIETLSPEIPETLESALQLPSNEVMRKGSNKNFFSKWFKNRGGKTETVTLENAMKATRSTERLAVTKEEVSEAVETPVPASPVQHAETESPQIYLDRLLVSRGYSTKRHDASSCGYSNKPTALQIASYDVNLVSMVRNRQLKDIEAMLKAGISANPCNKQGESLIHMIARRGDTEMLSLFQKYGCRFEIADTLGRTLLHDAVWASQPAFDTVELLLKKDIDMLLMNDSRQNTPLACARKEHWKQWIEFFEEKKDILWPQREANTVRQHSTLLRSPPNSCPIANPKHALTPELAQLVVCGTMETEEALLLRHENIDEVEETEREISERLFGAITLNLTERSFDMNDMDDILATLSGPSAKAELGTVHELEIEPIQEVPMSKMSQSNHAMRHELLEDSESSEENSDSDYDSDDSDYSSEDDDIMDADEMNELLAGLATMPPLSPQRQMKPAASSEPVVVKPTAPVVSKPSKRSSMGTAVTDPSTEHCDEDESNSEDDSEYDSEYSESEDYSEFMADMPIYVR